MIGSSVNLRFQQLQTSDTSSKGSSQQLLLPASNAMSAKQKCSVPRCQQPSWSLWKRRSSTLLIVVVEWLINIFLKAHSNLVNRRTLARPTNVFHSIHRPYSAIKCLTSAIKSWSSFLSLKSENRINLPEKIRLQCNHCAVVGLPFFSASQRDCWKSLSYFPICLCCISLCIEKTQAQRLLSFCFWHLAKNLTFGFLRCYSYLNCSFAFLVYR